MINVLLNGACGRMGLEVQKLIKNSTDIQILTRVDKYPTDESILYDINDNKEKVDIIIDFSNHLGTKQLINYAVKYNIPTIVCTTGQTDEEKQIIYDASKQIPIFYSANMSIGVALLCDLAVKTAVVMEDADIEIVETHHNRKLDAPSGTALMIANKIKNVRNNSVFKMGRNGQEKRSKDEIGIHSIRLGNIVGIHEVIVSTDSQTITLKHEAHSRALFAEGAITAAKFLITKPAGLYDMNSIIKEKN